MITRRSHQGSSLQSIASLMKLAFVPPLALAILFQVYPTFDSYFMADDFSLLQFVRTHESVSSIVLSPSPWGFTTPLPNVFIWVVSKLSPMNPGGYYAFNVLLHIINVVLVFELIRFVAARDDLALGTAVVFLVHFVHFSDWGVVAWISAFNQLVVALFYLCSLVLFIRYIQHRGAPHYVGSLICFALALASKETAASLPILLLGWYLIGLSPFRRRSTRDVAALVPFFLILGVYLSYEISFQSSGDYLQKGLYGLGPHILTNWKYFSNLVMPNPDSPPVHNYLLRTFPAWVLTFSRFLVWVVRATLLLLAIGLFRRGPNRIRLWIALAVITYLPFIGFVEGFAGPNRYFYLPAVGFSALLAEGLLWTWTHLRAQVTLRTAATVLVIGVLVLWGYNLVPIRAWQKQMIINSAIRQHALEMVEAQLTDEPVSKVYLEGFPDKFTDLRAAIRTFYSLDTVWVGATGKEDLQPSPDALILQYDEGQIIASRW